MKYPQFPQFTQSFDYDEVRRRGYDCGLNGANEKNCHFSLFATKEMTRAWEEGKLKGEAEKKRRENKP